MQNSKTILHVFSGDLWAGAEVMVCSLLRELKKRGEWQIIALSLNEGQLTQKLRDAGIEVHVISEESHSFPVILLKGLRQCKGKGIKLIHSHRYKENLLSFILAKCLGVSKLVATLHGLPDPGLGFSRWTTELNNFLMRKGFGITITVSAELKNALVSQHAFSLKQVEVIHNGVEIPYAIASATASMKHRSEMLHIGTVGRMVPVKDFSLFLDVAANILSCTKNVRFSILGEGPLKDKLVHQARILKISDHVDFLQPREDPYPYYQSLDVYLNTSIHEGIPMSILEAMACGKPVVAPRVGGIPEIITDGIEGILINSRDARSFEQGCLRLLDSQDVMRRLGINGRKRVMTNFSSDEMARKYHELYCNV